MSKEAKIGEFWRQTSSLQKNYELWGNSIKRFQFLIYTFKYVIVKFKMLALFNNFIINISKDSDNAEKKGNGNK